MKIIERNISELVPADYNPRKLSEKQFKEISESLTSFGFVDPVLVNIHPKRKDVIIGGHQRTKVWESLGHTTVPCVELNLTLKKEKELNVRLNKNSGSWDFDMLANHFDEQELMTWGFEDFELGMSDMNPDDFFDTHEEPEDKANDQSKIVLNYSEEDCDKVKKALLHHGETYEAAICKLLNL